ncbi:MAG: hypothetical protein JRF33_15495 [Deltaproteobacteria bacterium]|nr:hypothetical protein [Deltaproteobacteria bacterium]
MNRPRQKSPRSRFSPSRRFGLLGLLAILACGTGSITFTPDEDDAVMALLESTWAIEGTDGLQLSLCEDRVRSDGWDSPGACKEAHVVRGDGRGLEHKEDAAGIGCGGCFLGVRAYVRGLVSGGPFSEPVRVEGCVELGDLWNVDKVFAFPYRVNLTCTGEVPACDSITGELQENGQLDLEVHLDFDMPPEYQETLPLQGAASCTTE